MWKHFIPALAEVFLIATIISCRLIGSVSRSGIQSAFLFHVLKTHGLMRNMNWENDARKFGPIKFTVKRIHRPNGRSAS